MGGVIMLRKFAITTAFILAFATAAYAAAIDDVSLVTGESCGFYFGNQILLVNNSTSSAILVTVRRITHGELGRVSTSYSQYRVEPGEETSVGCTQTGGVGHEISSSTYSVVGARYVD
jgi:hypothetical protein